MYIYKQIKRASIVSRCFSFAFSEYIKHMKAIIFYIPIHSRENISGLLHANYVVIIIICMYT